jgi:tRNA pseudouridine55 synthase
LPDDGLARTIVPVSGGEVLLFDKPYGWTSFDVVGHVRNSIRTFLGLDSIKVGHAGTLDPLATGLLILCTGKATRLIDSIQGMEKTYTGTLRLGATTPSYDLETVIDKEYDWEYIDAGMLQEAARSLTGVLNRYHPHSLPSISTEKEPIKWRVKSTRIWNCLPAQWR